MGVPGFRSVACSGEDVVVEARRVYEKGVRGRLGSESEKG